MRFFISVELPEEIKKEVMRIQKEIDRLGLIKGKFTEPENLHLTLKFLGNLSESELRAVKLRLKGLKFESSEVLLENVGVFSENFIRIVWVGLTGKGVFNLQKQVDNLLEDLFPKEYRFMAHVTIARPKYVEDRKAFLEEFKKIIVSKKQFSIDKIFLKESILSNQGATYNTISEIFALNEEQIIAS